MGCSSARRAVVLLSGGLDSTTTLAIARAEGYECYALTVDYGQRHRIELEAARRVAAALGALDHVVVQVDLRRFGGSALTADIPVPTGRDPRAMTDIPVTYVPARNTVFLALALGWAETLEAEDLFIGVNALDYSVGGDAPVWVRSDGWARLMPIQDFCALPPGDYQTIALDPETFTFGWRPVTGRFQHDATHKRSFRVRLERGQEITITEDHSLFTMDPVTAQLTVVKGSHLEKGMPVVVPFDLSSTVHAWSADLQTVDLNGLPEASAALFERRSIVIKNGRVTNRLGRMSIPVHFPITDDFLYIVGLWLAEGGKGLDSRTATLRLSIGGIPRAVDTLRSYFHDFGVAVGKSPANNYDYAINSSVFVALFRFLGLLGMAKRGEKKFPHFFWNFSQRQRRIIIAGLWDGDGSHVYKHESSLAQKSHALIRDAYHCLLLDGIFPIIRDGPHSQKHLVLRRTSDFRRFVSLYPLRHPSKRAAYEARAGVTGRDQATGMWKCIGLWDAVATTTLPPGEKTKIYNAGGKYDVSLRAQRRAFASVPALRRLVSSRLAFLRVVDITETRMPRMYDLSVAGAENFVANAILAHNSGYPDCRPEYIEAFERMATLATKAGVEGKSRFRIHTPLIRMTKAEIVRRAAGLGVDFSLTWSCYVPGPDGRPCGTCDSCILRRKGFAEAGLPDPLAARVSGLSE